MSFLSEAQEVLDVYRKSLLVKIEEALQEFVSASKNGKKESALKAMKQDAQQLILLDEFCDRDSAKARPEQLSRLCVLLGQRMEESDAQEKNRILIHFYQTLDQLS